MPLLDDSSSSSSTSSSSPAPAQSSLSFTQGFFLGQLSVVLLIFAFIKFFIFGEAPPSPSRGLAKNRRSQSIYNLASSGSSSQSSRALRDNKPSTSNVLRPVPSSSTSTQSILRKTYYTAIPTNPSTVKHGRHRMHHSSHQPESMDWFNVLIAQTIAQYRQTAYVLKDSPTSSILGSLGEALNNPEKKPSFIDDIAVTDISLGEEFPIFSNCRIIAVDDPNSDGGRLQALLDVDLSDDNLSLAIETSLTLNYPKPYSAILPVALSVSVVRFSGTLCISLVPASTPSDDQIPTPSPSPSRSRRAAPTEETTRAHNDPPTATLPPKAESRKSNIAFSFLPDYRLDLSVRSLIGSRSRLQDVPKVAQLVEARVHAWFEERVVEPRVQVVGLPDLWPRMGRTSVRPGDEQDSATSASASASAAATPGSATAQVNNVGGSHMFGADGVHESPLRFRGHNMARHGSSGSVSDGLHMPGSMFDGVAAG